MYFTSEEKSYNTMKREVVVECNCGTHSIHIISYDDDPELYFEIWSSNFCTKQKPSLIKRIVNKIKMIWFAISNKEYRLEDIILNVSDIDNIIAALNSITKCKQEVNKQ